MKSLKHIALFLSCLVIASCTKDIDEKEPSNECSILDIQLTGQLGKATIEVSHFPVPLPLIFWSRYILMSLTAHVPT